MASLNLSINGPSIKSSYQGVINAQPPASSSSTWGQWALFSVQAPLMNAFQDSGAKESILKVESTGGKPIRALGHLAVASRVATKQLTAMISQRASLPILSKTSAKAEFSSLS
jgi:hypothetical protein